MSQFCEVIFIHNPLSRTYNLPINDIFKLNCVRNKFIYIHIYPSVALSSIDTEQNYLRQLIVSHVTPKKTVCT